MAPKTAKSKPNSNPPRRTSSSSRSHDQSATEATIYFRSHTSGPYAFMSQHYPCTFTAPVLYFPSAAGPSSMSAETLKFLSTEQYMMYHKALLFNDIDTASLIMETTNPKKQKALGRQVKGFDEGVWKRERERIVKEGNWAKFTACESEEGLGERLLATRGELVEASPVDRIWGIGFGRTNADANRKSWGLNLLGKALMRVRERLKAQQGAD